MKGHSHQHRIFGEGHAFRTADGVIYRIKNTVTVNGVDLVVYETVRAAADPEPAAMPVKQFARLLETQGALLYTDPSE